MRGWKIGSDLQWSLKVLRVAAVVLVATAASLAALDLAPWGLLSALRCELWPGLTAVAAIAWVVEWAEHRAAGA